MIKSCVALLIGLLLTLPAHGDIRVLIRFDSAGHAIHKVFTIPGRDDMQSLLAHREKRVRSLAESAGPLSPIDAGRAARHDIGTVIARKREHGDHIRPGYAQLTWFNEQGDRISRTWVTDPRAVRSPSHVDSSNASRAAVEKGAWVATGPDAASRITITLPPDFALGLGSEVWEVLIPTRK